MVINGKPVKLEREEAGSYIIFYDGAEVGYTHKMASGRWCAQWGWASAYHHTRDRAIEEVYDRAENGRQHKGYTGDRFLAGGRAW